MSKSDDKNTFVVRYVPESSAATDQMPSIPGLPHWRVMPMSKVNAEAFPNVPVEELDEFLRNRSIEKSKRFSGERFGPGAYAYGLVDPLADSDFREVRRKAVQIWRGGPYYKPSNSDDTEFIMVHRRDAYEAAARLGVTKAKTNFSTDEIEQRACAEMNKEFPNARLKWEEMREVSRQQWRENAKKTLFYEALERGEGDA